MTDTMSQTAGTVTPEGGVRGVMEAMNGTMATTVDSAPAVAETTAGKVAALANATAPLPMPEHAFSWGAYFQAIGMLMLLLAALWGGMWLLRRSGKLRFIPSPGDFPRDGLRLEAQLPLGPRKGVMVVRFLNRRLVLGVTDQQITLLTETYTDHEHTDAAFNDIMDAASEREPGKS